MILVVVVECQIGCLVIGYVYIFDYILIVIMLLLLMLYLDVLVCIGVFDMYVLIDCFVFDVVDWCNLVIVWYWCYICCIVWQLFVIDLFIGKMVFCFVEFVFDGLMYVMIFVSDFDVDVIVGCME